MDLWNYALGQSNDLYTPDSMHFMVSSGVLQIMGLRFRGCEGSAEYEWKDDTSTRNFSPA